ncbi:YqzH family protein [Peribacillus alkalitolerans]|uniref:YqzH family protein n=1 Tax=Peribacillus alkalitolerans TaxID=1550385 RepID=UPI0013D368F0|nr:YqzH family protein [Peribacillus alkalitolerans]
MDQALIKKYIRNCFLQYAHNQTSIPVGDEDYKDLIQQVEQIRKQQPSLEVHEIVHDVVYEYLTV